jgi:hypothetical protein
MVRDITEVSLSLSPWTRRYPLGLDHIRNGIQRAGVVIADVSGSKSERGV